VSANVVPTKSHLARGMPSWRVHWFAHATARWNIICAPHRIAAKTTGRKRKLATA